MTDLGELIAELRPKILFRTFFDYLVHHSCFTSAAVRFIHPLHRPQRFTTWDKKTACS